MIDINNIRDINDAYIFNGHQMDLVKIILIQNCFTWNVCMLCENLNISLSFLLDKENERENILNPSKNLDIRVYSE